VLLQSFEMIEGLLELCGKGLRLGMLGEDLAQESR
jgi:hypothetical protein